MAEFTPELQSSKQYSFSSEMNTNLEPTKNQSALENLDSSDNHGLKALSNSILFLTRQPQKSLNFAGNNNIVNESKNDNKKPIAETPLNVSVSRFCNQVEWKNKSSVERKRKEEAQEDMQNRKEIVHVRAKRGQATDSHSLAERVRREKINEKLRCLQDLVPGCYKAMGMAVMLDVIISYIQSLQNQIEFLSMNLSAASMYYDHNFSEIEAMETIEGIKRDANEQVQEMERMVREEYGGPSYFHSTWPL